MYIVAFRRSQQHVVVDPVLGTLATSDTVCLELGAESKVRAKIEEWRFFKVSEKLSDSDFVFLVSLDDSSMEGLTIPFDAYRATSKRSLIWTLARGSLFTLPGRAVEASYPWQIE
jgi:hypothetical protein